MLWATMHKDEHNHKHKHKQNKIFKMNSKTNSKVHNGDLSCETILGLRNLLLRDI